MKVNISVFGLGKLGSVFAAVHANNGHFVIGVDVNPEIIDKLKLGTSPFSEPELQNLISTGSENLKFTRDTKIAILSTDISYIIVPTPSKESGEFSNEFILNVIEDIAKHLRAKSTYHLIVINSTVMPGSCDGEIREQIEKFSGRKVGENLGLVYSPEFIALGNIVNDMKYPDLILIGESDKHAGDIAELVSRSVTEGETKVHRMALVNAEIVKIAINTFVTMKISFANMISEICDKLPHADVEIVTNAVGSDSRIGKKYLKAGLGYGGPCFPRDNVALKQVSIKFGTSYDLPEASDIINLRQPNRIIELILKLGLVNKKIAVMGLSYKPDTPVVDESQGILIANKLAKIAKKIYAHDPQANEFARTSLNDSIKIIPDVNEIIQISEVLIFCTPWNEYRKIPNIRMNNKIVIDCWRMFQKKDFGKDMLIHLGSK